METKAIEAGMQDETQGSGMTFGARGSDRPALRISWRDQLRIGLGPSSIALTGYRRGVRPRLSYQAVIPLEPSRADPRWQAAAQALPRLLEESGARRPHVTIVLSNQFVRYALLPWNPAIKRNAEWLALARHRFATVYGNAAETWVMRVSSTGSEAPRIASAIDAELLAALEAAISSLATLVSVQPSLAAAYNRLHTLIGRESCWLAIEEQERLTLGLLERGVWRAIRSRRRERTSRTTLAEILDRESALLTLDEPCTRVALCTDAPRAEDQRSNYEVLDLTFTGSAAPGERPLAMAAE
ncbi:MAG: hypothetical protein ACT4PS_06255 [Betaproteobacteria bacterium]